MTGDTQLFNNFRDSTTTAFCILNKKNSFLYFNDATFNILGCSREGLQKATFESLVEDIDQKKVLMALESAHAGAPEIFEARFACGGSYKWISWSVFTLDSNIYCIGHDVTELHEDQNTLQTAQNRLRLLHQATSNPNQSLSQKIERVLNLGNKQLGMKLGMVSKVEDNVFTLIQIKTDGIEVHKGQRFDAQQTFDSITLQAGNLIGIQNIQKSVYDEHPAHIKMKLNSYLAVPIYIDGSIFGVLSFQSDESHTEPFDITDFDFVRLIGQWISSSLALIFANEQVAYTAAIVESSEDAIIGQTTDGLITTWNKGAENLFHYKAEEVIGKHFSIIIPEDKEEEITTILEKLEKGESVDHYDTLRRKKNGSLVDVSVTVSPIINGDGEYIGSSSVARDITREKQIDKAKTEFVSLASHQLRTPLSAINWYSELLRDGEGGKMNKTQKEFVNEIFLGNQRMVRLVNELLNVSRIDFGNFIIEPVDIDIIEISRSVIKELTPAIVKNNLKVIEHYDSESLIYKADANILRIVIQNLISNSVKYTPTDGQIDVTIMKKIDTKQLLIEVTDNGFGIPKEQQNQIFSKLFRADNVKEMDAVGTGLGLYVLKSVVEESGGVVSFESEEGNGTTFTVLLPIEGMHGKDGGKALSQVTP